MLLNLNSSNSKIISSHSERRNAFDFDGGEQTPNSKTAFDFQHSININ